MKKMKSSVVASGLFLIAGAVQLLPHHIAKPVTYAIGILGMLALVYLTKDDEWSKSGPSPNRHVTAWVMLCVIVGALGAAGLTSPWLSGFGLLGKAPLGLLIGLAGCGIGALFAAAVLLMLRAVPRRSE